MVFSRVCFVRKCLFIENISVKSCIIVHSVQGAPTHQRINTENMKKGKRKVQGVPQSQTAVLPRHQEEEETDKTKQAQIEQTYEKH